MIARRLAGSLVLLAACDVGEAEPRDQWRVVIGTDAPITQLGDRVLVELLDESGAVACDACRREFGITPPEESLNGSQPTFPLSFGIVPDGSIALVRARLYRAERVGADGIELGDHVDAIGRLPRAEGLTEVGLVLGMGCFGIPADPITLRTCEPASKQLVAIPTLRSLEEQPLPETGSWPPARPVACGPVDADMACIEGGMFLMGAPDSREGLVSQASLPEHLIRVAPFAIDLDEVTVAEVKRSGRYALGIDPRPRGAAADLPEGLCTFPADIADTSRDAFPVDCVTQSTAAAICEALGKRLPSEDEWEFAAGGRTREWAFPWSDNESDVCGRAVVANGRTVLEVQLGVDTPEEEYECRGDRAPGPIAAGNPLDVTAQGVRNMAGNVSEWVADAYRPYTDPCWSVERGERRRAPCPATTTPDLEPYAVRGGSYATGPTTARITRRSQGAGSERAPGRGFRCAKSM